MKNNLSLWFGHTTNNSDVGYGDDYYDPQLVETDLQEEE